MKLKTYVSNFNGVNSNKFLCNAFIFIIYVSNSNGVNSNFILIIFFTNRRIVSNSNGVNSNRDENGKAPRSVLFQTPTE